MDIIVDKFISDYDEVKRTWVERLFSLPWNPLKKTKLIYNQKILSSGNNLYVSPKTASQIVEMGFDDSDIKDFIVRF